MYDYYSADKLPLEQRLVHRHWKVRADAYHELATEAGPVAADARAEWLDARRHYLLNMVTDTCQPAQAAGLTAATALVGATYGSPSNSRELVAGIVDKALPSSRIDVRMGARELLLVLCFVDTPAPVVAGVAGGFGARAPRAIVAALSAARAIVRAYGAKHIDAAALADALHAPLAHKCSDVRDEARLLAAELFRWVGDDVAHALHDLPPLQLKALEEHFAAAAADVPPKQLRLLRSEIVAITSVIGHGIIVDPAPEDDPWDTAEPVSTAHACPAGLAPRILSPEWRERMAAVELLHASLLCQVRLKVDVVTGALVRGLVGLVDDMHANVSLCAVRCLTQLALKLRRAFGPFVPDTLPALIGRFRVRKPAITSATRDAVDACFAAAGCDMAAIDTALAVGASHRCPQVRAETHRALHRRLAAAPMQLAAHCTETCAPLLAAALDDSDGAVRDAAAECIATLRKLAPEHNWAVYTQHIAKAKMRKINVFAGEATPPLVCASRA